MGTHVKIHVSALLDRAKIVVPKMTKIFGSGTRTGVTGLRRPIVEANLSMHPYSFDTNEVVCNLHFF